MSEFASMLASFKKNAESSKQQQTQSRSKSNQQKQSTTTDRKRPHPNTTSAYNKNLSIPSFPSIHANVRRSGSFELSFLVVGAQKAGTSWLHTLLQQCKDVSLPRDQKEVHFWDWHYRKGINWYINQFDYPINKSSSSNNNPHYGEITPDYIVLPSQTILEISKCYPQLKLIFIARNLLDRVWSAMIMELRDQSFGLNAGEFHKGVITGGDTTSSNNKKAKHSSSSSSSMSVAQQRRIQQQSSPSAQSDEYYLERLRSETHTSRSDYAKHLKHWYTHFPSENILLVDFRDIESKPREVLLKIVMHIGVTESEARAYIDQLNDDHVRQRVNAATNTSSTDKTGTSSQHSLSERPRLKRQIEQYLHPFAVNFNALLKEKGYTWKLDE